MAHDLFYFNKDGGELNRRGRRKVLTKSKKEMKRCSKAEKKLSS